MEVRFIQNKLMSLLNTVIVGRGFFTERKTPHFQYSKSESVKRI